MADYKKIMDDTVQHVNQLSEVMLTVQKQMLVFGSLVDAILDELKEADPLFGAKIKQRVEKTVSQFDEDTQKFWQSLGGKAPAASSNFVPTVIQGGLPDDQP